MSDTMITMFNPLEKFNVGLLNAIQNKGERYLVSQSYQPGIDHFWEPGKDSILLTPYTHREQAAVHLQLICCDKYKALIDLENEKHRTRIIEILEPHSKYVVYSALIADKKRVEKRANHRYKAQMFRFIRRYTSWMVQPHEVLEAHLTLLYGVFMVSIERFGERIQLTLKDLENT